MNALVLKLLVGQRDPHVVAEELRRVADALEAGTLDEQDFHDAAGKVCGTLRVPERKPALQPLHAPPKVTKPKRAPKVGEPRCDLARALRLATDLHTELAKGMPGAAGIVVSDMLAPVEGVRFRLERLCDFEREEAA